MKSLLFFLSLLLINTLSFGQQIIQIPDIEFKNQLINNSNLNTNNDSEIQVSEALAVTKLDLNEGIKNLKGLDEFINLTELNIKVNTVDSIDLKPLTQLITLRIDGYQQISAIKSIDLSKNLKLETLYLSSLSIDSVDVQHLNQLDDLELSRNPNLTQVDLSKNGNLGKVFLFENPLESLILPHSDQLGVLWTTGTKFKSIDLTNLTGNGLNLEFNHSALEKLDISDLIVNELQTKNSPNLNTICTDPVKNQNTNIYKDPHTIINQNCIPESNDYVYIPDSTFKQLLIDDATINTDSDGGIQYHEAEAVLELMLTGEIKDLTGIEAFTEIKKIQLWDNNLSSADFSKNIKLEDLNLGHLNNTSQSIEEINLSQNTLLERLYLTNTLIDSINLTALKSLKYLEISYAPRLQKLDLSQNNQLKQVFLFHDNALKQLKLPITTELSDLRLRNTQLHDLNISRIQTPNYVSLEIADKTIEKIDISNNTNIEIINVRESPMLYKLCIDSTNNKDTQIYSYSHTIVSEDCSDRPVVYIPDQNFKNLLLTNYSINTNLDDEIQIDEALATDSIVTFGASEVNDLTGLEAFINLTDLVLGYAKIDSINLQANTKLEKLWLIVFDSLTTIDISTNKQLQEVVIASSNIENIHLPSTNSLTHLTISTTKIKDIDLSGLTGEGVKLQVLYNQNLTELNVQQVEGLDTLLTTNSPDLNLICTDATFHNNLYYEKDEHTILSTNCILSYEEKTFYTNKITIYPNPAKEVVNVESEYEINAFTVTDLNGSVISRPDNSNNVINISNLKPGLFLLEIDTDYGKTIKKLYKR